MKTTFYRAFKTKGKTHFVADTGYLYAVVSHVGTIEFAIAKIAPGEWDITHYNSGLLACVKTYRTKKEALRQLDDPDYIATVSRLTNNEQTKTLTQLLSIHKFKLEEI